MSAGHVLLLGATNPKRKRRSSTRKRRSSARRARVSHMRRNPRYKTRRRWSTKMEANPRHRRRHHARRMHRNPRRRHSSGGRGIKGFVNHTVLPAFVGAGGALLLDVTLGLIPMPAALQGKWIKPIVGIAGAGALGLAAAKVAGKHNGQLVALGGVLVVAYNLLKSTLQTAAPSVPVSGLGMEQVGWVNPAMPAGTMGMYVGNSQPTQVVQPMNSGAAQPMGEYVGFGY